MEASASQFILLRTRTRRELFRIYFLCRREKWAEVLHPHESWKLLFFVPLSGEQRDFSRKGSQYMLSQIFLDSSEIEDFEGQKSWVLDVWFGTIFQRSSLANSPTDCSLSDKRNVRFPYLRWNRTENHSRINFMEINRLIRKGSQFTFLIIKRARFRALFSSPIEPVGRVGKIQHDADAKKASNFYHRVFGEYNGAEDNRKNGRTSGGWAWAVSHKLNEISPPLLVSLLRHGQAAERDCNTLHY